MTATLPQSQSTMSPAEFMEAERIIREIREALADGVSVAHAPARIGAELVRLKQGRCWLLNGNPDFDAYLSDEWGYQPRLAREMMAQGRAQGHRLDRSEPIRPSPAPPDISPPADIGQPIIIPEPQKESTMKHDEIPSTVIDLATVRPSRWQPRQAFDADELLALAESIEQHGQAVPVLVFAENGTHELIAGERRVRARMALAMEKNGQGGYGLKYWVKYAAREDFWNSLSVTARGPRLVAGEPIVARVWPAEDLGAVHELVLIENLQRVDLSPLERAHAVQGLVESGLSQAAIAKRLGKSQPTISQWLSLLRLDETARGAVLDGTISATAAAELAGAPPEAQAILVQHMDKEELDLGEGKRKSKLRARTLASQIKDLLDPIRYAIPEDDVVSPHDRNDMRALRWCIEHRTPESIERLVKAATNIGYSVLGHPPYKWGSSTVWDMTRAAVPLSQDEVQAGGNAWGALALKNGWTCENCQLRALQDLGSIAGYEVPCSRAKEKSEEKDTVRTCPNYTGPEDPVVIVVEWMVAYRWPEGMEDDLGYLSRRHNRYCQSVDVYRHAHQIMSLKEQKADEELERRRQQAHMADLIKYQELLQDERLKPHLAHFLAHTCDRCENYQPELAEEHQGVPCIYATKPIKPGFGNPRGPDSAILVSQDGRMVPRCERFRMNEDTLTVLQTQLREQLTGWMIPKGDRNLILKMFEALDQDKGGLGIWGGPLAWLPYPRKHNDTTADHPKLRTWLRKRWDEFGDDGLADLLRLAVQEAEASHVWTGWGYGSKVVELWIPGNAAKEQWRPIQVQHFEHSTTPHGYPDSWPTPWVVEEKPESEAAAEPVEE